MSEIAGDSGSGKAGRTAGTGSLAGQIVKASLIITAITVACKLMGGVEKFLLPFVYGAEKADRFQAELYLAMAVLAVMFYDIMRYSIIPVLMPALVRVRERMGEERSVRLAGFFANALALIVAPLLIAGALYPDGVNSLLFVHKDIAPAGPAEGAAAEAAARIEAEYARDMVLARAMFRIMVPAGLFLVLGGVAYCLLQSSRRFAESALGDLAYKVCSLLPLLAVVAAAWLGGSGGREWALRSGIYWIAMGVLLGAAGLLAIQLFALRRDLPAYRFAIDLKDGDFRAVWREAAWPLLYAVLFVGARRVLDIYFGGEFNARFGDRGYYMGLEFSYRIVEAPFRFLVEPLGYALFPFLVAQHASGDRAGFVRTLSGGLRVMVLILLPLSALMFMLRGQAASLLLPGTPGMISVPLAFYALGAFGFGIELLLTRAVFATDDARTPALLELAAIALHVGIVLSAGKTSLAHGSVGLGFAVSRTAKAAAMAAVLAARTRGAGAEWGGWAAFLARVVPACAVSCLTAWACLWALDAAGLGPGTVSYTHL
ncbi:MAG: hypothetical protein N3A38_13895, partial [Planctomycetota bacterium]|nr:hypothetical protein [Planctomycetota bacterium]